MAKMLTLIVVCFYIISTVSCNECEEVFACVDCMPYPDMRCFQCQPGYTLASPTLCELDCMPNCKTCEASRCKECKTGYYVFYTGDCFPCSNIGAGCAECETDHSSSILVCRGCEPGYTLSQGTCVPECSITKRPVQDLPALYKGMTIFVDFPFQCAGRVTSVEFYARNAGKFYLSAWKPSAVNYQWSLHGSIEITSDSEGLQTYAVPDEDTLQVEASYVIGIFYSQEDQFKIIPSKNVRKNQRDGSSSRYIRTRENVEDLHNSITKSSLVNNGKSQRTIPLNVYISP